MIKILKKIAFEIKMFFMDLGWNLSMDRCWKSYPPSFYHRYTEEEQKRIWERDKAEIMRLLDGTEEIQRAQTEKQKMVK